MTEPFPTADEICTIAVDESRSLAEEADVIAREYHRLALAMADRLGRDDLNWCGFAQWSSKRIGASLRLDRGSDFWTRARRAFGVPWFLGGLFRLVLRTLLGGAYGRGLSIANRSIFLEIGTFYVSLLSGGDTCSVHENGALQHQQFDHPLIGELTESEKEHLLFTARLFRAAESASGTERSHLVFATNVALSAHEQSRVQRTLEYVLHRPPRWLSRVSWRLPLSWITGRPLRRFDIYTEPHADQPWLTRYLETIWSRGFVRSFGLDIPGGEVAVSRLLARPTSHPTPLLDATFEDPTAAMVARFHPDLGTRMAGVRDWLDYEDRMRFIVSYFMAYQNDQRMFDPPFAGPRPAGPITRLVARCTGWMSRRVRVPRIIDPALENLEQLAIEPHPVVLGYC